MESNDNFHVPAKSTLKHWAEQGEKIINNKKKIKADDFSYILCTIEQNIYMSVIAYLTHII